MLDQPLSGTNKRLHLGCGLNTPKGWVHVDGSWNAWLASHPVLRKLLRGLRLVPASAVEVAWAKGIIVHDVRKPLPFPDSTFVAVYASHLLEHLFLQEAKTLLSECFRVLKPGGVLRVVVPDLRAIILEYLGEKSFSSMPPELETMAPADRLNRRLRLRDPEPPSGSVVYRIYRALKDFHTHKWMYDADSLSRLFSQAGFVEVSEMQFRDSRIEGIQEVEEPGRTLGGEGIIIEGIKP